MPHTPKNSVVTGWVHFPTSIQSKEDLLAWRRRRQLTMYQAAALLGIFHRTYSAYENGKRRIPHPVAIAIDRIAEHDELIPEAISKVNWATPAYSVRADPTKHGSNNRGGRPRKNPPNPISKRRPRLQASVGR